MPELLLITLYIIGGLVLLFFGADFLAPGTRTDVEDRGEEIAEQILERARREGRKRKVSAEPC